MSFRAPEEAADAARELLERYCHSIPPFGRAAARRTLAELIDAYGPVVESYPTWHPLLANGGGVEERIKQWTYTRPSDGRGWKGIDHPIYLQRAFITCLYGPPSTVIDSVRCPSISVEQLPVRIYADRDDVSHLLVRSSIDAQAPRYQMAQATGSIIIDWDKGQFAESWKPISSYLLGSPHGDRSSLFVNEHVGVTIKRVYVTLANAGMYGTFGKPPYHV